MEVTVESLSSAGMVKEGSSGPCAPYAREKITGWLLKRKGEGARTRMMSGVNRRFFTLDFQSQVFYYAHSESGKSVSVPTPFCKILGVEPLQGAVLPEGAAEEQQAETVAPSIERTPSKNSMTSHFRMPKMPGFGAQKRPVEHHGLAVRTADRRWELLCSSQAEAEVWLEGFREAAVIGGRIYATAEAGSAEKPLDDAIKAETSTASCSSNRTAPSTRSPSPFDSETHNDEEDEDLVPEVLAPTVLLAGTAATGPATPPAKATTPEKEVNEEKDEKRSPSKSGSFRLRPPRQPKSGRQAASRSGPSTDAAEDVTALGMSGEGEVVGAQAWGLAQSGSSEVRGAIAAQSAACRYEDKGRGLSVEQRLSQMQFSDSEDEDAQISQKTPKASRSWRRGRKGEPPSAPGPASPEPDSIEACQSFVQEEDSSDNGAESC